MSRHPIASSLMLAALFALTATPSVAQHPQTRKGFWFNGGLGWGSLGCEKCDGRTGGLSGGISLGGTVSPHFLLGGGTTFWYKKEGGTSLTVGTLDVRMRLYPWAKGGFFLTGGLGVGTISAAVGAFGARENGVGLVLGLGYDIRIGNNVSLTPFWNGYGVKSSDSDANVAQIGLSITAH